MMRGMKRWLGLVVASSISGMFSIAAAQEMGQGEANITAEAQVRMSLESGPATNSTKLALIGGVVGDRLSTIRECYRERTTERPEIQGELRILVTLEAGGGDVDIRHDGLEDRVLVRCVKRALEAAEFSRVRPPGGAFVTLTFTNSAADGVVATRERRAVEDAAEVTTNADGRLEASGRTEQGEVRFRVVGSRRSTEPQVQAVHRVVRAAFPTLLDCRRKAARRHLPYGEIFAALRISPAGRAAVRVRRSTVEDERGPRCVTRALQRSRFDREARGAIDVVIEFAERPGDPAPTPPTPMRRRR